MIPWYGKSKSTERSEQKEEKNVIGKASEIQCEFGFAILNENGVCVFGMYLFPDTQK